MEDVPLVEFMYLVFTCMPSESYYRQLRSLLFVLCILKTDKLPCMLILIFLVIIVSFPCLGIRPDITIMVDWV